ncbi:hypothetical protein OC846_004618 [Tilletia horrida]|uniref:Acetyl-CoA synthetase-like protein n=1 Tax=Tilletia horrida TaxID=155126 RepID=A0AAN6GMF2_9BASI|nr:hypothetical protein OC845_006107 [Tilletia horrida]KAK0548099.1 hypothetical protein OC846_004618 [Tilletia horrida]
MTIYTSAGPSVDHFPTDMDLYTFMFEYFPKNRPDVRGKRVPLLIDDDTGTKLTLEEIHERVDLLSLGMADRFPDVNNHTVAIFSVNLIDYPIAVWATHRLGGVVSGANPAYTAGELKYQLEASNAKTLFTMEEPAALKVALEAAEKAGIPKERIVVIESPASLAKKRGSRSDGLTTVSDLVEAGAKVLKKKGRGVLASTRRKLGPGEGKQKLAFLSFSSGTTGLPKGVKIAHSNPIANVLQYTAFNEIPNKIGVRGVRHTPGRDVALGVLPLYHIYGLVVILHSMLWHGTAVVVVPRFKGIVPFLDSVVKYRISHWILVPPMIVLFVKDPAVEKYLDRVRSIVRFCMVGAAPLSEDLAQKFVEKLPGVDFGQGYGMTESSTVVTLVAPRQKPEYGSAGRVFSNTEARIVKPDGKDAAKGESGELWMRGPQITLGYLNNEKATKEMWVEGGWLRTGDEAIINEAGDIFIVDRLKELIKVKGFQVPPAELEGLLLDLPEVNDAGVVSIPDDAAGELPIAFISLSADAKKQVASGGDAEAQKIKDKVKKYVQEHKVKYKWLAGVQIIETIPKTASGKILRRELRGLAKGLKPDPVVRDAISKL